MRKALIVSLVLNLLQPLVSVAGAGSLKQVITHGGQGEFNCAYQKRVATKPCQVKVVDELTKHAEVLAFANSKKPLSIRVLRIIWPDQTSSQYWFSDSLSMFNLDQQSGWGYEIRQAPGDGMEIDWRRGFIIEKEGKEHLRLW